MAFLFVNKTATSTCLTRSENVEASAIQHFVQKGRKRARKARSSTSSGTRSSRNSISFKDVPKARRDSSQTSISSISELSISEETRTEEETAAPDENYFDVDNSELALSPPNSPSLIRLSAASAMDPFKVSSVAIDATTRNLILYYIKVWHPTMWPLETSALRRGAHVFESAVNHVVQASIHDDLAMFSLLAATACRARYVDRIPTLASSKKEHQYMNNALQLMQSRINEAASDPKVDLLHLLDSVIFLSAAEGYMDNVRGARAHLDACIAILAHHGQGVIDVADKDRQGQLLMSDIYCSCIDLTCCVISSDVYDPGPASTLKLKPHEINPMPLESLKLGQALLENTIVSREMRVFVLRIVETYSVKLRLNTASMDSDRALKTSHWITKRNMAIRNNLLSVFPHPNHLNERVYSREVHSLKGHDERLDPTDSLDKAIRVVLIQFTLLSMNITGRIKTVKTMARHLQNLLEPLLLARSAKGAPCDPELLLWMLIIGYSCAADASKTETWFATQCHAVIDVLFPLPPHTKGAEEWASRMEQLETLQHTFFYHTPVQRPRLKQLLVTNPNS